MVKFYHKCNDSSIPKFALFAVIGRLQESFGTKSDFLWVENNMSNTNDLWMVIRDARDARGWTNERLAAESGVPESSIQKYLTGKTAEPRYDSVIRLCRALGISVDAACGIDSNSAVEEIAQLRTALALAEERSKTADARRETAETRLESQMHEYSQMVDAYEYRIHISKDRTIWLRRYLMFTLALILFLVIAITGILIYDAIHQDIGWLQSAAVQYIACTQLVKDIFV